MPHQCLKCGQLFPDGSSQILRGCPECQGTRFFYTEEALKAPERATLLKQGEADIKTILEELTQGSKAPSGPSSSKPGDDEPAETTFEAVGTRKDTRKKVPQVPPAQETKALPGNKLLVKLRRRKLAKRMQNATASRGWDYDAGDEESVGGPRRAEEDGPDAPDREGSGALGGIPVIGTPDDAAPWPTAPDEADERHGGPEVERVSYGDEPEPAPEAEPEAPPAEPPSSRAPDAPRFEIREVAESEDGGVPETVRIDAPGQYAIDVKRLLEEAPIVVQKDGSYLIHLPSLFESDEKRRMQGR